MKNLLIVGLLGVSGGLVTNARAQAVDSGVDAGAVDAGLSSGDSAETQSSTRVEFEDAGGEAGAATSDVAAEPDASTSEDGGGIVDGGGIEVSDAADDGDAGDAGADTSSAADVTSAPKPPPEVREYELIENEGRACSVASIGHRSSQFGAAAGWLAGLLLGVGLRRQSRRARA